MSHRVLVALVALVLALVAFGVFAGSLNNEFVWDDPIVFDRQLPYFDSAANIFFPPRGIPQFGTHYYRPAIVITYVVDEWIAKTFWSEDEREHARRVVYHTSPVVYHVCATLLVFALGTALIRAARGQTSLVTLERKDADRAAILLPAAGAVLFAVHPIHVESVAWMAGRSDVVCGIFFLACLLAYLRYRLRSSMVWLAVALALAACAMLSKETGVGLILMLPLIDWLIPRRLSRVENSGTRAERRRRERSGEAQGKTSLPAWAAWLAFVGVAFAYLLLRRAGIDSMTSPSLGASAEYGRLPGAIGWYVARALWPGPQSAFVAEVPGGVFAAIGIASVVLAVAAFAWLGPRRRAVAELLAVGVFLSSLVLSLFIALFPISETPLAERYLYIPTTGLCLLIPMLAFRLGEWVRLRETVGAYATVCLAGLIAVPAAARVVERAEVWSNNLSFWEDAVEKAGRYGLPHLHLGMVYSEKRENEKAKREYEEALAKYDDSEGRAKAHNNLGSLLLSMGRLDEAIGHFRAALQEDREYETPHYNWALALLNIANQKSGEERGRLVKDALAQFEEAIRKNPRYVKAHFQYGVLLFRLRQYDLARSHLEQVVRLSAASPEGREARTYLERIASGKTS